MAIKLHDFTEIEAEQILRLEREARDRRHDQWCNEHEGKFTDADGVETMANHDKFYGP